MRLSTLCNIVGLAICLAAVMIIYTAHGMSVYPPLAYLASELGVSKGVQLPKGVVWNNRPFFFYITSAQEHPNGRYTVELQALQAHQ